MRKLVVIAALLAGACAPPQTDDGFVDMGPMPVVAALYDSPLPATQADREIYFTRELATALTQNAASTNGDALDFDYRSWANDPEVVNIKYAVGQHSDNHNAEISTRFTYPGVGDGMNLTWTMCRRADREWRISDITAIDVSDQPSPGSGEAISLRVLLGLEPATACD